MIWARTATGKAMPPRLLLELGWKAVPLALLAFLVTGWPYAVFRLFPFLCFQQQSCLLAVAWITEFHAALLPLIYCFYLVAWPQSDLGAPPREVPQTLLTRRSVHAIHHKYKA